LTSFARKGSAAQGGYNSGGGAQSNRSRSNSKKRGDSARSRLSQNFHINETIRSQNSSSISKMLKS
jgi:hypothetical protein